MMHDNQQVQEYWNRDDVESMYDKHLLKAGTERYRSHSTRLLCDRSQPTQLLNRVPRMQNRKLQDSADNLDLLCVYSCPGR